MIAYRYLKNCRYVLDAGTGTGRFAVYLAEKGIDVVAIDASIEMILLAREKANHGGYEDKTNFLVGDIENLPFKSNIFEGVCSIYVLIHFISRYQIISEFSRVLQKEGIVVFDVPNKILSGGYWRVMKTFGKTTFRDYHYNLKEINDIFSINSIKTLDRTNIIKIPRGILHFFLCVLKLTFLIPVIERFEGYNFGATSIIKGIKKDGK